MRIASALAVFWILWVVGLGLCLLRMDFEGAAFFGIGVLVISLALYGSMKEKP